MTFWTITAKDLYLLARDRRTATNLLLLPLAFITIIGLTTGKLLGWQSSNQRLKIAAVDLTDYEGIGSAEFMKPPKGTEDEDGEATPAEPLGADERKRETNRARHLVRNILNGIQQRQGIEVRTLEEWRKLRGLEPAKGDPVAIAKEMLANDDMNAALIFQPDFYQRFYHLKAVDLVARDGEDTSPESKFEKMGIALLTKDPQTSAAAALQGIVGYQAQTVLQPVLLYRDGEWTVQERASKDFQRAFGPVQRMTTAPPPKLLPPKRDGSTALGNDAYQDLVPSYTTMFVFFLVNLMARSFIAEREIGTLRRLRAAPISGWSILLGKTLPFLVLSLVQTAILFLAGKLLFGMEWGPKPWLLLPVIFATSCAATGLGLLIATLVKTDSQVSAYATFTVIVLAGISGCFMPRKWLPDFMQQASLATPHAWALIAYDQILSNAVPNVVIVWQCVGMLLAFAAGFFLLGGWRFRDAG